MQQGARRRRDNGLDTCLNFLHNATMNRRHTTTLITWLLAVFLFELATWAPLQARYQRGLSSTSSPSTTTTYAGPDGVMVAVKHKSMVCGMRDDTPSWLAYLYLPADQFSKGPAKRWMGLYEGWWRERMK
jgi:hypothetical protein